jgi:nucleoside phosphorylase
MRIARLFLAIAVVAACAVAPSARAQDCPTLILGAMPVEIGPFLAHATISARTDVPADDGHQTKSFFSGRIGNRDVVMAMTGIGTVNALETTHLALDRFGCFDAVVFSGVSGGNAHENIGDVLAPSSWALDLWDTSGHMTRSSYTADPALLSVAADASSSLALSQDGRLGDCGCVGVDPNDTPAIHFPDPPVIRIGGTLSGHTSDPFGGNPLPCTPGTDTFGCQPCMHENVAALDPAGAAATAIPFATPNFYNWFAAWRLGENGSFDVEDMETAAVASVAAGKAPFIGFRSPSDGANGDPLVVVPGPFGFVPQFLAYRQYAADHAAEVALAFLAR